MKPKITFISNTCWSLWNFRKDTLTSLSEIANCIPVAPRDKFTEKFIQNNFDTFECNISPRGMNPLKDLYFLIQLFFLFKKIKPAVSVHYTIKPNIYGAIAGFCTGTKNIAVVSGLGFTFTNEGIGSLFARFLYKLALRFSHEVWFLNTADINTFINLKIAPESKCFLMPGEGVDTSTYISSEIPTVEKLEPTFLMIARLLKEKGVYEFAAAARALKKKGYKAKFQIIGKIGDGSFSAVRNEDLKIWISEGTLEHLPETDNIIPIIEKADCIVLPSYREGLSRSLLEAASMSKPIIASDVPGCAELVENGKSGFLVKVKDAKSLETAFISFINLTEKERNLMGQRGRALVVDKYSNAKVLDFYKERLSQFGILS